MYLSSKHQSTGDLGGMRYANRLLSKNLICPSVHVIIHFILLEEAMSAGEHAL